MKKIIKFEASWCQPCKAYAPLFDQVTAQYKDIFEILKSDIDEEDLYKKYEVRSVPTTIIVDDEKVVGLKRGVPTRAELTKLIESNIV